MSISFAKKATVDRTTSLWVDCNLIHSTSSLLGAQPDGACRAESRSLFPRRAGWAAPARIRDGKSRARPTEGWLDRRNSLYRGAAWTRAESCERMAGELEPLALWRWLTIGAQQVRVAWAEQGAERASEPARAPCQADVLAAMQRMQAEAILAPGVAMRVLGSLGCGMADEVVGVAQGSTAARRFNELMMAPPSGRRPRARCRRRRSRPSSRSIPGVRVDHMPLDRAGATNALNLELRRKCGYKRRSRAAGPGGESPRRGRARSAPFVGLPEEERAAACEMDTVVGNKSNRRCLLTCASGPAGFSSRCSTLLQQGLRIDVGQARRA